MQLAHNERVRETVADPATKADLMQSLARRLNNVKPSAINAVADKVSELKTMGRDPIDLGIGEPDFDTPDTIKQAAIEAIRRGETKYTPLNGTPALREAIRIKFRRDNGLDYPADRIAVSGGAKLVIFNAMMATLDPGDEVVIPAPYWTSYPDIVRIAEGVPVFVPCSQEYGFKLRPQDLEAAITPKTKWLFLNSPSNPTGTAYGRDDLMALAKVLMKHQQVLVLSDDIYEHLVYDGLGFVTMAQVEPALAGRTLTLNGVSKAYAMTGWRIGWLVAREDLAERATQLNEFIISHAPSFAQKAGETALRHGEEPLREMLVNLKRNRDYCVEALARMPGVRVPSPDGAFYLFPTIEGCEDSFELCRRILMDQKVGLAPGVAFGAGGEGSSRICHASERPCCPSPTKGWSHRTNG